MTCIDRVWLLGGVVLGGLVTEVALVCLRR